MERMVMFFVTYRINMKNEYKFELLPQKEIYIGEDKDELFFAMLNTIKHGMFLRKIDTFIDLKNELHGDKYYIAHNIVTHKGKKAFFIGLMAISSKENLINFLIESNANKDLRDFLISPVFRDSPSYVVSIADEAIFLFT